MILYLLQTIQQIMSFYDVNVISFVKLRCMVHFGIDYEVFKLPVLNKICKIDHKLYSWLFRATIGI